MSKKVLEKIREMNYIDPENEIFKETHKILEETLRLTVELNGGYKTPEEVREILGKITGEEIDESNQIITPFNTDFGRNLKLGKGIFINKCCMFVDLGGIEICDNVLIGPEVKILSVNHPINPRERRGVYLKKVKIENNAWIGAGAVICPGVTIGENSIVAAGAVVTKDVPKNTVYGGNPAKLIKDIPLEN